mgnify:FL=1|jgi:hypothetical protein
MTDGWRGAVYFEFQAIGRQVRVTAIDGATGTEAIVIAPIGAARGDVERLALRKLERRLELEGKL